MGYIDCIVEGMGGSFHTWNVYGSKASGGYCVASREFSTLGQFCTVLPPNMNDAPLKVKY